MSYLYQRPGFTLTEILLVLAVSSSILLIGAPVYERLVVSNEVDVAANVIVADLYRAQSNSRNVARDSNWGVAVNGQTITLFSGTSYLTRNVALDENYLVPSAITITGSSSEVFTKLTGLPSGSGSIILQNANKSRTVTWTSKGMVDY